MTSRKRYYELKAAGLCTKCTDPIGDSPSKVRCQLCYEKYTKKRQEIKKIKKIKGLCMQCGLGSATEGNYCLKCHTEIEDIKRELNYKTLVCYNEKNINCRICDGDIDTLGLICNKCLSSFNFTFTDALRRYGEICNTCDEQDFKNLRFVSSKIETAMPKHGPNLYKIICFNKNILPDYRVLCHGCYRTECLEYVKDVRNFFEVNKKSV